MNEGKDDVVIIVVSTPEMVIAPEWVKNTMSRHKIKLNGKKTTQTKVYWGVKQPIKGYQTKLIDVIEKIMVFDPKAASWLRDNFLKTSNDLIFVEEKCCVLSN